MDDLRDRLDALDAAIIAWKAAHAGTERSDTYKAVDAAQRDVGTFRERIGMAARSTPQDAAQDAPEGDHVTYRQEYIRCGKSPCRRCDEGEGHGPYWYSYRREGGRLRKKYIGKTRP